MKQKQRDFFDNLFATTEHPYGTKPVPLIDHYAAKFPKDHKIIDLGCGDGNNIQSLWNDYEILAVDFSEEAIKRLDARLVENNIAKVETKVVDLGVYDPVVDVKEVGGVICTMVLHFLAKAEAIELIKKAQKVTINGGLHLITDFLPSEMMPHNLTETEIRNLYSNDEWDVEFNIKTVQMRHRDKNGELQFQESFALAATKK